MRVCIEKATGKLIEAQSGGDVLGHLDTLLQNAISAGYSEADIEVSFVTDVEYQAILETNAAVEATLLPHIRAQRDMLLLQSDWTQLVDSPLADEDKATWSVYRQDLRDIPQDYPTGSGIVWPETPTY